MTDNPQMTMHPAEIRHEDARRSAMKFINEYFRNPDRERPRTCIPAQSDDDDILLIDYIRQQEAKDAK